MNNKILKRCIEISRALRPNNPVGKSHHTSFAVYKSRIVCVGMNDYKKSHPYHKIGVYEDHKGFETAYRASLHSEVSLAIKMGLEDWNDYEIVNVRIGFDDKIRIACPCKNCEIHIIKALKPKRVFFTDNNEQFVEMNLN